MVYDAAYDEEKRGREKRAPSVEKKVRFSSLICCHAVTSVFMWEKILPLNAVHISFLDSRQKGRGIVVFTAHRRRQQQQRDEAKKKAEQLFVVT